LAITIAFLAYLPAFAAGSKKKVIETYKEKPKVSSNDRVLASEYKEFAREVSDIIGKMKEVAAGREKDDMRVLEFRLREYNEAVSARDWHKADSIRDSLKVSLSRGSAVASDAGRRKAIRARAEAQARHREALRQQERLAEQERKQREQQHQELMNQIRQNQFRGR
jgi:hypothetical protein